MDTGEHADEAMRPVYEAGGGEQDGFELAERDLVRNASHDDGTAFPERDGFTPERESDRSPAEYAESDGVEPHDLYGPALASPQRARSRFQLPWGHGHRSRSRSTTAGSRSCASIAPNAATR